MTVKKIDPIVYLKNLKERGVQPNWWCSFEYFEKAELIVIEDDLGYRVFDNQSKRQQMFPTVRNGRWGRNPKGYWADFLNYPETGEQEFLDFEYIYRPYDFMNMSGSNWSVFRKNSRKFPKRIGEELVYRPIGQEDQKKVEEVLCEWANNFQIIQDGKVLIDFVLFGSNRKGLFGIETGKLYGINVWDENYRFINFRYSVLLNIPFLAEYLRLLFYRDFSTGMKMVNDGGVLGRESLKKFKDKMNPYNIRKVFGKEKS